MLRVLPLVAGAALAAGTALAQPDPSTPRLELRPNDRVILIGNTLADRQQYFNHFETTLLALYPQLQLSVRNLGWSADTLTLQPRPLNFGDATQHLTAQKADVMIAFFGANESFEGEAGLPQFEKDLEAYIAQHRAAKYNGAEAPRLAMVSPIAHERIDATRPRGRRRTQPRTGAIHRRDASGHGSSRRPVRRRLHADARGDGIGEGTTDGQRHAPERRGRQGVRGRAAHGPRPGARGTARRFEELRRSARA